MDAREIDHNITEFKKDLEVLEAIDVVRKHVIFGGCYALKDDLYFKLRSEVAAQFKIHPNEVLVVGSAKLGFSLSPNKLFRHFSDDSDIDVVLVSSWLFDQVWRSVFDFWRDGGYWERQEPFQKYLFQGWLRPDQLPPSHRFSFCRDWWEYFRKLTSKGEYGAYKVAAALYKDWYFLERYHRISIDACLRNIDGNHEN